MKSENPEAKKGLCVRQEHGTGTGAWERVLSCIEHEQADVDDNGAYGTGVVSSFRLLTSVDFGSAPNNPVLPFATKASQITCVRFQPEAIVSTSIPRSFCILSFSCFAFLFLS